MWSLSDAVVDEDGARDDVALGDECALGTRSSGQRCRARAEREGSHRDDFCGGRGGFRSFACESRTRRNGTSPKTIQGESGQLPIAVPRDREGRFEPQLLGPYQRRLPGCDEKRLALYAKGMTTRDIQDRVQEF